MCWPRQRGLEAVDVPQETIRNSLCAFRADMHDCPGRFNLLEIGGADVVIDDSHNSSAAGGGAAARQFSALSGGRSCIRPATGADAEIIRQGEQLGAAFDRVILYEDYSACDRAAGEVTALFRQGLAAGKRAVDIIDVGEHRQAVETALTLVGHGELVVIQPEDEDIEQTLDIIRNLMRPEAAEESGCFLGIDSN